MDPARKVPTIADLEGRPRGPHQRTATVVGSDLSRPFHRGSGGPGGW